MSWLPADFVHPERVDLSTGRHHLRPIRAAAVDLDMVAVMGSRRRLWSMYGEAWGWPPPTMTHEQDREDLARHEAAEIAAHLRPARRQLGAVAGAAVGAHREHREVTGAR